MKVINVRNVHQALPEALYQLRSDGVRRESRNGPVVMFPEPVTTVYGRPEERVLFWPERDANPFFHLMESLWMLAGRNDVEYVSQFVSRMRSFSDDGRTFHGAYGYRWRNFFFGDQLPKIIEALKANPDDRRQVLSMWDPDADLGRVGKDLPCNLQVIFQVACDGRLDMLVTNRSNDMIWGAYGANAVHFSVLHEFMARAIGVPVGYYRQVSANAHFYVATLEKVEHLADQALDPHNLFSQPKDPYQIGEVSPFPVMAIPYKQWLDELDMFMTDPDAIGFTDPFFRKVAVPMFRAHKAYKDTSHFSRFDNARAWIEQVQASDWKKAAHEWINRREASYNAARDDGVGHE